MATLQSTNARPKIIVLDDDPTGSQTVHSCLLLLKWDVATLKLALEDASPIFFVLTNTRSLTSEAARSITTDVCTNLKQALAETNITNFLLVSRSDSTLRGHYPVETNAIADILGPFDAHFLTPAFFEAGRITLQSTHYIEDTNGIRTPTHETEFAQDSVFGYSTSYLPDYVAEKTKGNISASQVERFQIEDIRSGTLERLLALHSNQCVAVDAQTQSDLDQFANDLITAATHGKKFLFRSAASLLTSLAALPEQPTPSKKMHQLTRSNNGVVLVGSHVQTTTRQLKHLLQEPGIIGIEIDVSQLQIPEDQRLEDQNLEDQNSEDQNPEDLEKVCNKILATLLSQIQRAHAHGKTPVVYTSRKELTFPKASDRLAFGKAVSALLTALVKNLPTDLGYLISKGGITSNDTLSQGLSLTAARLLGQIIPGVSVVTTPADHVQFANLPVILFPGNVGDDNALALTYKRLSAAD